MNNKNIIKEYKQIEVQFPNIDYEPFREKDTNQLTHIIRQGRLGQDMVLDGYYSMSQNEECKQNHQPYFYDFKFETEEFMRRRITALVYDISGSERNTSTYNKMIILTHTINKTGYYHYVLVDTNTNRCSSHFYKNKNPTDFLNDLNTTFNRLSETREINQFLQKSLKADKHAKDIDNMHLITMGMFLF